MADNEPEPETEADPEPSPSVASLAATAVDLTLGLLALGASSLRAAPELAAKLPVRAAEVALVASERAQHEIDHLVVRGASVRSTLMGLLAGRFLGPPVAPDEPAEVDPFDQLLDDPADLAAQEAPRVVPFVVVSPATPAPVEQSDDLPLEGFDDMTLGALRAKARQLGLADLETLLDRERTHGARPGVLSLLETRIAQLQQEQSAG